AKKADVSAFAGYEVRGQADQFDMPTGAFRWGVGAAFPSRSPVRVNTELDGFVPNKDTASIIPILLQANDLSATPSPVATENLTRATIGVTYQAPKGFFLGVGLSWNLPRQERDAHRDADNDPFADYWDWQV